MIMPEGEEIVQDFLPRFQRSLMFIHDILSWGSLRSPQAFKYRAFGPEQLRLTCYEWQVFGRPGAIPILGPGTKGGTPMARFKTKGGTPVAQRLQLQVVPAGQESKDASSHTTEQPSSNQSGWRRGWGSSCLPCWRSVYNACWRSVPSGH